MGSHKQEKKALKPLSYNECNESIIVEVEKNFKVHALKRAIKSYISILQCSHTKTPLERSAICVISL